MATVKELQRILRKYDKYATVEIKSNKLQIKKGSYYGGVSSFDELTLDADITIEKIL